jgi:hypothetical protein
MQQALDSNTLDRLISLGRKQGYLTNQDLEANLPIDSMSAEEIALIVVHLEEMGFRSSWMTASSPLIRNRASRLRRLPRSYPSRAALRRRRRERRKIPLQTGAPLNSDCQTGDAGRRQSRSALGRCGAGMLVLVVLVGLLFLTAI